MQLTGLDVGASGRVSATRTDLYSGRATTTAPAFVIGADGWRSDTRRLVGIDMLGDDDLGTSRSVRFRADLSPWFGSPPPAFVRLLSCKGVLLPTHPDDRWVAVRTGVDPRVPPPADFVRDALGVEVPVEVLGDDTWTAGVQQAEQFSSGPVFLIGDAAHRVTPAGATGISSAMADAHNLTWKIAAVLAGWGGPGLLDTYAAERAEVARILCAVNLQIWGDVLADRMTDVDLRLLDMGYVYVSDVIQADPSSGAETSGWGQEADSTKSAYVPAARPGARAPHAWIHADGRRISTIDLFGRGFVVLTDDLGASWIDAARLVAANGMPPITAVTLSEPSAALAYALAPGEVVLVRPDGHVAWRSGPSTHDPSREDATSPAELSL